MNGAQAIVQGLMAEGVRVVFGYPGATLCPLYDALRDSPIHHVLTRNEQNAGHAANGYARISGKPGVCIVTSGPGATNLFTAIATAYMDSIPLVAITGQVPTGQLGRDVFQEVDTTGAAAPFTKYCVLVKEAAQLPRILKEAFYIASTGRPGPVLLDIPMDVQQQLLEFQYPQEVSIRGYKPQFQGHPVQVKRVAAALRQARRPLLCVGGGAQSPAAKEGVRRLCEQLKLPAVSTLMGLGVLPTAHPCNFGMVGQAGSPLANRLVRESDLLLIVGARVGERAVASPQSLAGEAVIVHIDIDSAEINKNLGTTIPLVGDAGAVLAQLLEQPLGAGWPDWAAQLAQERPVPKSSQREAPLDPRWFLHTLSTRMAADSIYVADVGQNQLWSAQSCLIREGGRFLTSGGLGTMGYALPAALGAQLAAPGRQVVAVCGDGAFQMSMMELATLGQEGLPVKLVVVKNQMLGLVREIQEDSYQDREYAVQLGDPPHIGRIAAAYGIPYCRVDRASQASEGIQALLAAPGPFLLECTVDPREKTH